MNGPSMLTAVSTPVILMAIAVVAAALLLSRGLLSVLAVGVLALGTWKLDLMQLAANARRYADNQIVMPLDQLHATQFCVGLATGLCVSSSLLFVRPFAKMVLVATTLAILYVLGTESVPGLIRYASAALHFLQEFDFFTKGLLAGKFLAGLVKWKQLRGRRGLPT
jgi:hypothetical protein